MSASLLRGLLLPNRPTDLRFHIYALYPCEKAPTKLPGVFAATAVAGTGCAERRLHQFRGSPRALTQLCILIRIRYLYLSYFQSFGNPLICRVSAARVPQVSSFRSYKVPGIV